jgi:hypothetical protein
MNNKDEGSNENSINNIDMMTITVTTVMATVIIIQYLSILWLKSWMAKYKTGKNIRKMTLMHINKQGSNINQTQDGTKVKSCI